MFYGFHVCTRDNENLKVNLFSPKNTKIKQQQNYFKKKYAKTNKK